MPLLFALAMLGAQVPAPAKQAEMRDPAVILIRAQGADFTVLSSHARRRGDRLWVFGRVARSNRLVQGRCTITVRDRAATVLGRIACGDFPARGPAVVSFSGTIQMPQNDAKQALDVQVEAGPADGATPADRT